MRRKKGMKRRKKNEMMWKILRWKRGGRSRSRWRRVRRRVQHSKILRYLILIKVFKFWVLMYFRDKWICWKVEEEHEEEAEEEVEEKHENEERHP